MKALLLIAHGSRRESSNDEIRALTAQIRDFAGEFERVECAFLEMAQPGIVQGGENLIRDGAREIVALPYFLAAGAHVLTDIPAEIARIEKRHPGVRITLLPHIGAATGVTQLVCGHLRRAAERPGA